MKLGSGRRFHSSFSFTIVCEDNLKFKASLTCIAKLDIFFWGGAGTATRNPEAIDRQLRPPDFSPCPEYAAA